MSFETQQTEAIRRNENITVSPLIFQEVKTHAAALERLDFWKGVQKGLGKIDGEKFVEALPSFLALTLTTATVIGLVWFQSLDLYRSSGFLQPGITAAGAIIMIMGFAAAHALSRSWIALLLCLYAGGYEAFFMISGTVQNEHSAFQASIENDPELVFLKEKAEKTRAAYTALKTRYDDPSSDVHNNDWFKKKHLDPVWDLNEREQQAFISKRTLLEQTGDAQHVTWLKVLYRLGLVCLCMVLVHRFALRVARW